MRALAEFHFCSGIHFRDNFLLLPFADGYLLFYHLIIFFSIEIRSEIDSY